MLVPGSDARPQPLSPDGLGIPDRARDHRRPSQTPLSRGVSSLLGDDHLYKGAPVRDDREQQARLRHASRDVSLTRRLSVAISLLSHGPQMTGAATYARELIRALGARADE